MRTRQTQGRTWQTPRCTWQVRGPSSSKCRPIGGLFLFVSRKWSKYPDCAPKRRASKPCIKMDSSESWHFAQLSTQAFGNMAPSADHCPPSPASDQLWKRNSAHNQDILTTTPKTHEAISVIRKSLFIAHGETLIFIHLRKNEGRRATVRPNRTHTRALTGWDAMPSNAPNSRHR